MPDKKKYHQINWVDGMKINKTHFIAQENSVTERINDARQTGLHSYNYGLLPFSSSRESPVKIVLYLDNQQTLRVKVFECCAVTPGGARIEISESLEPEGFTASLPETVYEISKIRQEDLFVAITVNPFKAVPAGEIDPEEDPPRHPYTLPELKVHLIPESQLGKKESGLNMVLIGKIHVAEAGPELVKEYIPPSATVMSHPRLVAIHAGLDQFLSQLELDLVTILKKIQDKEQTNVLATTLASVAEPLLLYLGTSILEFRWKIPVSPPIEMFERIARGARVFKNALDANAGKAKEELFNYFTEWCTLKQGDLESILHHTVNFGYDHSNIHKTADIMVEYAGIISALFSKLSTLEYIGKKKETSIFVKEQTANKKSFLAD